MPNCQLPHGDNVFQLGAKGHTGLPKPNGVLPFAHSVVIFHRFLHPKISKDMRNTRSPQKAPPLTNQPTKIKKNHVFQPKITALTNLHPNKSQTSAKTQLLLQIFSKATKQPNKPSLPHEKNETKNNKKRMI